jgi:hypothetical protein
MTSAEAKVEHAAASPWTKRLARLGLVAKGVLYLAVGLLALLVAIRGRGRLEDRSGVLQVVADEPFGKLLLFVVAVGLAGYALWRTLEAVLGHTLETREDEGFFKRIGFAGRAILYASLCVTALLLIVDSGSAGDGKNEDRATGWALDQPLGRWLVTAVGVGFLAAAAFNGYRAVTGKFRDRLKLDQLSRAEERWAMRIGVVGHAARMVVFGLVGAFLIRAAYQYDPKEAIGLDGALAKIAHQPYGSILLGTAAAGLAAYGLYCFIEARYREI